MNRFTKQINTLPRRATAVFVAVSLLSMWLVNFQTAHAANLTSMSATMSSHKQSADTNFTIVFTSPTGSANNTSFTIEFDDGGTAFDLTGVTEDDVDVSGSTFGEFTTAADCTGSENIGVTVDTGTDTITFELCNGDSGEIAAGETITVEVGTNATSSGTGANQITNPSSGTNYEIVIDVNSSTDTGEIGVPILSDDQIAVTATVNPSVTLTLAANACGFGDLTAANARFATTGGGANGPTATSCTTGTVGTNATGGYVLSYSTPATLTSGSDTITAATISGDEDGTPGSEQFALGIETSGDGSITSAYNQASNNYSLVADGTDQTLMSENAPSAAETVTYYFLSNITSETEAGIYSATFDISAVGTF
jgi:hypothetical protein